MKMSLKLFELRSGISVLLAFICITALSTASLGQRNRSIQTSDDKKDGVIVFDANIAPVAVVIGGNPTCATLNASTDPAFAHIASNWGLKINRDGKDAFDEVFPFNNGPDTELQGGAATDSFSSLRIQVDGSAVNWESNKAITVVIVKGGDQGANVYPYNPPSLGGVDPNEPGNGLNTGDQNTISHLVFCFQSIGPTASPASVSGRVLSAEGIGIRGVVLSLTNLSTGEVQSALTNSFGHYMFEELELLDFYMITVSSKRHRFNDPVRTFTLEEDLGGVDFIQTQ